MATSGSNSHQQYTADARTQASAVDDLRATYAKLRDEQLEALGEVKAAELETEAARKKAAEGRRQEAASLEHQVKLLEMIGAEQRELVELQNRATALRVQAARIDGNAAEEAKQTAKLEIQLAKQVGDARKQSATAAAAAERERVAHVKEAEAAERNAARVAEAAAREREAALGRAISDANRLDATMKDVARHTQESAQQMSALAQASGGFTAIASRIGSIATGLQSLVQMGRDAINLVDTYATESYAVQATSKNLQLDITSARDAVQGLVSDYDLARTANLAYSMGVAKTGDEFGRIVGLVRTRAEQLGKDQQQMLSDYVEGVGKQESEIMDNLGMVLRLTDAYSIHAETIGKAAKELTAAEKAEAYNAAALKELERLTKQGTAAVDGFARSWKEAKVELENFKDGLFKFEDRWGKVKEALRSLSDEELKQLEFAQAVDDNSAAAREYLPLIEKWGLSLTDLRMATEQFAGATKELRHDWGNMFDIERARRAEEELKRQQEAAEAAVMAQVDSLKLEADEIDHVNDLLDEAGQKERMNLIRQIESLELRREAAELQATITKSTEDEAKALEYKRKIEVVQAKIDNLGKKKKGGGSGPTEADRLRAELDAQLDAAESELRLLELRNDLAGKASEAEVETARRRHELELARLDAERRVLEVTKAKNSVERTKNEARLRELEREREILDAEKRLADRAREVELIGEATAATKARAAAELELARQDAERVAEVIQLDDYRYKRAEQNIRHRGELDAASARNDLDRLQAQQRMEVELHHNRLQQLRAEHDARVRELDARQAAAESMAVDTEPERLARQDELRQVTHDRELERLEHEMAVRRAMETEKVAQVERERALQEQQMARISEAIATFESFRSQITELTSFFGEIQAKEADAELARTVANLEAKGQAQRESLEREIAAAEGNVKRQNDLRRQQARQDAALRRQIEEAERKHQEKRERQEMRSQAIQLWIVAAVETVKAIAAYASYNYVEGALHTGAAIVAGIKAGMLSAGKVPGAGSVGGMGAGAGGMAANDSGQQFADPSDIPGSVPGEAARRESATDRGAVRSGGGTVFNGPVTIQAWGSIDDDVTIKLARELDNARNMVVEA